MTGRARIVISEVGFGATRRDFRGHLFSVPKRQKLPKNPSLECFLMVGIGEN